MARYVRMDRCHGLFLCIWGDGMQREGRQERGQGVAGGAMEREWHRMGSRGETEREWQGMDGQRMDESEEMAENGQQRDNREGMA